MTHVRSGSILITDAPVDNQGRGESFSPTDLVAGALASCMITIMGIAAREHGFELGNIEADILKIMSENPRKIGAVEIDLFFEKEDFTEKEIKIIEKCAYTCPVYLSLSEEMRKEIRFHWGRKKGLQ